MMSYNEAQAKQAAARRLQWEASVRHSKMQRDARRHEICRVIMWAVICGVLWCAAVPAVEFLTRSTP